MSPMRQVATVGLTRLGQQAKGVPSLDENTPLDGSEPTPSSVTTPLPVQSITSGEQIGILSLFLTQLGDVERRISKKIDENSRAAAGRWKDHEADHAEQAEALRHLTERFDTHLRKEADEDLIFQARLGPVKTAGSWIRREWRTISIIVLIILSFMSRLFDLVPGLVRPTQ